MSKEKLKPCPFCGSKPERKEHYSGAIRVLCPTCLVCMKPSAWNTRTPDNKKSTTACRKGCDVYEDWQKAGDDNVTLQGELDKAKLLNVFYVEGLDKNSELIERLQIRNNEQAEINEQLQGEVEKLKPFEAALKGWHNGYDVNNDHPEPKTPQQACDDLQAEWDSTENEYADDVVMLQGENKRLKAQLDKLKGLWEETGKIIAYLFTDDETFSVGEDLEKLREQALPEEEGGE